ncbi:uncharacterized protein B0I36DRAFT_345065 [Microdochium trichocladiopsis]|uniref:Zn(2)-C6 fungal-type domain-containing protein n=1 Tax=Microdochium trichocladiopsis TaxID=1682393 RepID=A0A9P8YJ57_9PEZI|nr:uncharacterized protein B0I36DRAFT_345065 [Microdochium trichocladiopsis]KAH7041466.1 hypothetical protein B0I36DRAFT_345065 [Microdochium trichocladiopsis]
MTAPKFPRRRAPHTKVSTGCYSCKKRRLKCDEARPICIRCQKAGFDCEFPTGPATVSARACPVVPVIRDISRQSISPGPTCTPAGMRLKPAEALYFDFFRSTVIHELATHSYSPLDLTRTILRECARDEAVRLSVISIGALGLANRSPRSKADAYNLSKVNHAAWRDALSHHTKAISLFRSQLGNRQSSGPPPRSILILSVLFILFELAQGNTQTVDSLTSVALSALKDPLQLRADTTAASKVPAELDDEGVRGLENLFSLSTTYGTFALPMYTNQTRLISTLDICPLRTAVPGGVPQDSYLPLRAALTHWEAFVGRAALWGVRCWSIVTSTGHDITDPKMQESRQRFLSQLLEWEAIMQVSAARETTEEGSLAWLELFYGVNLLYAFVGASLGVSECRYDQYVDRYRVGIDMVEKRILAIVMKQQQQDGSVTDSKSSPGSKSSPPKREESRPQSKAATSCSPAAETTDSRQRPSSTTSSNSSTSASPLPNTPQPHHETDTQAIPPQSFPMPVLNSRLLQSLCISVRACRDRPVRLRILALCKIVVNQGSTWDDKATYIGSKVMVELEEAKRLYKIPSSGIDVLASAAAHDNDATSLGGGGSGHFVGSSTTKDEPKEPVEPELDLTVTGLPVESRLRWEHAEWAPGRVGLSMAFIYPTSGETVTVGVDNTGEYGYLMC